VNPGEFARLLYPRTVAAVTSIDSQGKANAAPYSWVCPVSYSPAMLLVGIQDRETWTLKNIKETKEFAVNIVTKDWAEKAIALGGKFEKGENKLEKLGIETAEGEKIKAPAIKNAKIVMECVLSEILKPEKADHVLVIGEIVAAKTEQPENSEVLMHLSGNKFIFSGEEKEIER